MADPDKELVLRDRKLLEAAANGWSGEEIEEEYGIPAAQAIVRIRQILASRNVFTEIEKKQLVLWSAYRLKEQIEANLDLDDSKSVDVYLKVLKSLGEMLDKSTKITEEEMEAAARAQARALLSLIEQAYGRVRTWLALEYPEVDVDTADALLNQAMLEIASEDDE